MAKRDDHEEHMNHEAWAIPYADLLTLLLAFFVVMYAISSTNEHKYKIVATSMKEAFEGPPKSPKPVQLGHVQTAGSDFDRPTVLLTGANTPAIDRNISRADREQAAKQQLNDLSDRLTNALEGLVKQRLVNIRRVNNHLEVEIQSDILFSSGSSRPSTQAVSTTRLIGEVLSSETNALRVEGYTDNVPIRTTTFRSNWELSSARSASIVHELIDSGIDQDRLAISAYGENHPVGDNDTEAGRNANRRVLLVVMPHTVLMESIDRGENKIPVEVLQENFQDVAVKSDPNLSESTTIQTSVSSGTPAITSL